MTASELDRVLLLNTTCAELRFLAAGLNERGALLRYVAPYVHKSRSLDRAFSGTPVIRRAYASTWGRRYPPPGVPMSLIERAGLPSDLLRAVSHRVRRRAPNWGQALARFAAYRGLAAIDDAGVNNLVEAQAVVTNVGCGLRTLEHARSQGTHAILNYPSAHHRRARRILAEEAQTWPRLAGTLGSHAHPGWLQGRIDKECALADLILVGSRFARDSFTEEGFPSQKVAVLPYGVDNERFSPRGHDYDDDVFRILFVGQITQAKGIGYLLQAYQAVQSPDTSLTLVGDFVGPPSAFAPYRHLFHHIRHVPHGLLPDYYRSADVFVFPTLSEGLGHVVLEALASGLPVITTFQGPNQVVRDGIDGFLVPLRNKEAIIDRLRTLRADPALLRRMSLNARDRASHFSWDSYSANALGLLRGLRGLS